MTQDERMDQDARKIGGGYRGGGSAGQSAGPAGGGGYLETCSADRVDFLGGASGRDPRLDELEACGLNELWLQVADLIGFESFILVWSLLDQAEPLMDDRRRLYVPCIESTWLRYQRDLIIEALTDAGWSPADIEKSVRQHLGGHISRRTIQRLVARRRRGDT